MRRVFKHTGIADIREEYREERGTRMKNRAKMGWLRIKFTRMFRANMDWQCQLWVGDSKFPRAKMMTNAQMWKENRELEATFYRKLGEDHTIKPRLFVWKVDNYARHTAIMWSYVGARLEGVEHDRAMEHSLQKA